MQCCMLCMRHVVQQQQWRQALAVMQGLFSVIACYAAACLDILCQRVSGRPAASLPGGSGYRGNLLRQFCGFRLPLFHAFASACVSCGPAFLPSPFYQQCPGPQLSIPKHSVARRLACRERLTKVSEQHVEPQLALLSAVMMCACDLGVQQPYKPKSF